MKMETKWTLSTDRPDPEGSANSGFAGINGKIMPYVATILLVAISWLLIRNDDVVDYILALIGGGVIIYMIVLSGRYNREQQQRIWVILLLLLFTTVFWTFFELAGSALNLFTDRNVNKNIMGAELTTTFFQAVNPLFIMIFAPIYSWMWIKLGQMNKEPAAPYKFGMGLILLGLGFLVLTVGKASAIGGMVPAIFLITLYLLHTLGELTLSPVGLSLVTKLAPSQIVGFLMGIWFLSSSIAHQAGKHIANFTAVNEQEIVQSDSFRECFSDETLEAALQQPNVLDGKSLEETLVSDDFVSALNASSSTPYYVARLQIKEIKEKADKMTNEVARDKELNKSFVTVLTKNPEFAQNVNVISRADVVTAVEGSATGNVISCLKGDSLNLSLGVFRMLGFFAIGCGLLLFVLGPMVSRWMHGIK
ncbi:MAG: oligopeptide:H+ symporter [Saprospiraceae bacterium]